MIDFAEELSKFRPAREVNETGAGEDETDLADILFEMTRVISGKSGGE